MSGDIESVVGDFEPGKEKPSDGFQLVPIGWYPLLIEKSDVKGTKKGDGKYLNLQFCVTGENYANRKVFKRIHLANPSQVCVDIGRKELANLGQALGMTKIKDSSELQEKFVMGKVVIKDNENDISAFKPMDGANAASPQSSSQVGAKPAAKPEGKLPWQQ